MHRVCRSLTSPAPDTAGNREPSLTILRGEQIDNFQAFVVLLDTECKKPRNVEQPGRSWDGQALATPSPTPASPTPAVSCHWCRAKSRLCNATGSLNGRRSVRERVRRALSSATALCKPLKRADKGPHVSLDLSPCPSGSPSAEREDPPAGPSSPVISELDPMAFVISELDPMAAVPSELYTQGFNSSWELPTSIDSKPANVSELPTESPYLSASELPVSEVCPGQTGRSYPDTALTTPLTPERSPTDVSVMSDTYGSPKGRLSLVTPHSSFSSATTHMSISTTQTSVFDGPIVDSPTDFDDDCSMDGRSSWHMCLEPEPKAPWNPPFPFVGAETDRPEEVWRPSLRPAQRMAMSTPASHSDDPHLALSHQPTPAAILEQSGWYSELQRLPRGPQPFEADYSSFWRAGLSLFGPDPFQFEGLLEPLAFSGGNFQFQPELYVPPMPYLQDHHSPHDMQPLSATPEHAEHIWEMEADNEFRGEPVDFAESPVEGGRLPSYISTTDGPPEVRKATEADKTPLKRTPRVSRASRHCDPCGWSPSGPRQGKKMERHLSSDKHRRRTGQDTVDRFICYGVTLKGSICGRRFGRRDNFRQHYRKLHGPLEPLGGTPSSSCHEESGDED